MLINWKHNDGGNKDSQGKHNRFNLSEGPALRRKLFKSEQPVLINQTSFIAKYKAVLFMPVQKHVN